MHKQLHNPLQQFKILFVNRWGAVVFSCVSLISGNSQCKTSSFVLWGDFSSVSRPFSVKKAPDTLTALLLATRGSYQTAPVLSACLTLLLFWELHFPDTQFTYIGHVETGQTYGCSGEKPLQISFKVPCRAHGLCYCDAGGSQWSAEISAQPILHRKLL